MFTFRHATMQDSESLGALLDRCASEDGRSALSEFKYLRVPVANGVRSLVADGHDGHLIALGVAAWHPAEIGEAAGYWAGELAVDPQYRSVSAYGAVISALEAELGNCPAIWTFDEVQAAAAASWGLEETRAIVEMRRLLPDEPIALPAGYLIRSFVEGSDERPWLLLNQRVFAHHPEAGSIDGADLALRMAQPWFDPAGLLLLAHSGSLIGYCWTKLHPRGLGEIYMIGLVPEYRGKGLAKPLTSAGLQYLTDAGAGEAMLYAEAANAAAIGLYESMGFVVGRRVGVHGRR